MTRSTSSTDFVPGLDPVASARWFSLGRQESPWLHEEVGARMAERLQWFRELPSSWLHWDPMLGGLETHRRLRERLPAADCFLWAHRLDEALIATTEAGPRSWNPFQRARAFSPNPVREDTQVQMLWANMGLHMAAHPQALIRRWHSLTAVGGFLMFACLGPDSLRELRALYESQGWPTPAHAFTDMHDWGDMLVHAGFAEPVMDMERITLSFASAERLLAELRGLGRNLSVDRQPLTRSRHWRSRLLQSIEDQVPRDAQGRLLLSFEIIYGHAFKAAPRPVVAPTSTVAVSDLRDMLRQRRA